MMHQHFIENSWRQANFIYKIFQNDYYNHFQIIQLTKITAKNQVISKRKRMKIVKKQKVDVKKFMEEIKANRTNRSYTTMENTFLRDDRSQKPNRLTNLYNSRSKELTDRGKSIPPPMERTMNYPPQPNYAPQPNYPMQYQHSSQFYQPSQSFMSTPPLIYNPNAMMNYSQTYQPSQMPPAYNKFLNEPHSNNFEHNYYQNSLRLTNNVNNRPQRNSLYEGNSNIKDEPVYQTNTFGSLKQPVQEEQFDNLKGSKSIEIRNIIKHQKAEQNIQIKEIKQEKTMEKPELQQGITKVKKKVGRKKKEVIAAQKIKIQQNKLAQQINRQIDDKSKGQKLDQLKKRFQDFLNDKIEALIIKNSLREKYQEEQQLYLQLQKIEKMNSLQNDKQLSRAKALLDSIKNNNNPGDGPSKIKTKTKK